MTKTHLVILSCFYFNKLTFSFYRDAESSKASVDTRVRPPHDPTFSSNVQGILRTKVEGGEYASLVLVFLSTLIMTRK